MITNERVHAYLKTPALYETTVSTENGVYVASSYAEVGEMDVAERISVSFICQTYELADNAIDSISTKRTPPPRA